MKIVHLQQSKEARAVEVTAVMNEAEFEQLAGTLDNLHVFATKTITERASVIQTGARSQFASYLLLPVKFRHRFKTDEYDFGNLVCGALALKDKLYVIYEVTRKGLGPSLADESRRSSTTAQPEDRLGSEIRELKKQFSSRKSV